VKTAWVLRGGASFGAAQVGMAQALLEAGHVPDLLYGTSVGSINATWLAAGPTLDRLRGLEELWLKVTTRDVFPLRLSPLLLGITGRNDHLVSPDSLRRWLNRSSPLRCIEDASVPLTVVATDIENGDQVLIDKGPVVEALMASSAMPGIFPPVRLMGRWLVDGGVASDTPLWAAADAGADRAFVLPSIAASPSGPPRTALEAVLRSASISLARESARAMAAWAGRLEVYALPAPVVPGASPFRFDKSRLLISAGYELAKSWLEHPKPMATGPGYAAEPGCNVRAR
jgi:NTE family protein